MCPEPVLALTRLPVGGRSAHSRERAVVACWLCPGIGSVRAGLLSIVLYLCGVAAHTPAPRRGEGAGGRGSPAPAGARSRGHHPAAQGGGAAQAGAGGARPGERRDGPPDRAGPERSPPDPQGRAESAPAQPNKIKGSVLLGCVTANQTKREFCWVGRPEGRGLLAGEGMGRSGLLRCGHCFAPGGRPISLDTE